jgi:diguanylate cyclase (GGDEF)-like protein/PAS domain S-box-containing protein
MFIDAITDNKLFTPPCRSRLWLGTATAIAVVEEMSLMVLRLFDVPRHSEFGLLFHVILLGIVALGFLRLTDPLAGLWKKAPLMIGVTLCKGVTTLIGFKLQIESVWASDALDVAIVTVLLLGVLWLLQNDKPARTVERPHVSGATAHQRVRFTMYLLLLAVSSSSALQAWQVHKAEHLRTADAQLMNLAGIQGSFSQRISRIAGMPQREASEGQLRQALTDLDTHTRKLEKLLADEMTTAQTNQADNLAGLEQAILRWRNQEKILVVLSRELLQYMEEGLTIELNPASRNIQAQADVAMNASQGLVDQLQIAVQARNRNALNAISGWSVFNLILLVLLALGVVEPVVRLIQRQYQRLSSQAGELERLALVAERTTNAVVITDARRKIVWTNQAFERITGHRAQDAVGKTVQSVLLSDRSDPLQVAAIQTALHSGRGIRTQLLIHGPDGTDRWLDVDAQPLHDPQGQLNGFIFVKSDVTEQMTQQMRLASILAALPSGVVVHSVEGNVIECNPAAEKIIGVTREGFMNRSWPENTNWRVVREDLSELPPSEYPAQQTLRTGQPLSGFTCGLAMTDGRTRWILVNTELMHNALGELTGVVSCLVDVTERRAQQDLLALAVEGEGVGTWQAEMLNGEMTCNDRFFHMLGYHRHDIPSQLETWAKRIHPDDVSMWDDTLHTHLSHPTLPFRCEMRLQCRDGTWAWLMVSGTTLERNDDGSSRRIAGVNVDITEQKGLRTQLINSERIDNLTQLPNRIVALERVQMALTRAHAEPDYQFAVLHIDADRFKQINDTLGHAVGDDLLRLIANRLKSTLRPNDAISRSWGDAQTAARIGGDEFVIVLEGIRTTEDASGVAQRLLDSLSKPYVIDGNHIHSSASIGVITREHAGIDAETILRDADIAMYEAKRAGRARFVVFEPGMHNRLAARASVENDLRRALKENELFVVYQPVLQMGTGVTTGVEALVRWRHPTRGFVPPVEFIPVAEETGLIGALGDFVLETACKQFMEWQRSLRSLAPTTLAVNLSRAQLSLPGLVDDVRSILTASGMPAHQLQLEITESLAAQDEEVQARLRELKAVGVTLALDDFGTGYSSLACLHLMPVDTVKIDRSFVSPSETSSHHRVLIEATIRVAQSLGMTTVAEGIETAGQSELLRAMHCDKGQGYLFSKPLPADELVKWLATRPQAEAEPDAGQPPAPAPQAVVAAAS